MQYQTTAPQYAQRNGGDHWRRSILESSIVNAWKLNVLVNKRLGLQNISQLQFRIKLAIDLLLIPDEEEPMEEEESDLERLTI